MLYNGDAKWTAPESVAETIEHHDVLSHYGIGLAPVVHERSECYKWWQQSQYLKIAENEYTSETLLQIQNIVSTLFLAENHYNVEQLEHELLELFEKEDRMAISLFLNWFKMLAVDGRIDSTDYQAFEKIYTNQMEVRQMFATAISEKDKRLIQEGKAEGLAEGELRAMKKMAKQMKTDGLSDKAISKYTGLSEEEIENL